MRAFVCVSKKDFHCVPSFDENQCGWVHSHRELSCTFQSRLCVAYAQFLLTLHTCDIWIIYKLLPFNDLTEASSYPFIRIWALPCCSFHCSLPSLIPLRRSWITNRPFVITQLKIPKEKRTVETKRSPFWSPSLRHSTRQTKKWRWPPYSRFLLHLLSTTKAVRPRWMISSKVID